MAQKIYSETIGAEKKKKFRKKRKKMKADLEDEGIFKHLKEKK